MNRQTQPDTHAIEATESQINWLNRIADISQKYRTNASWLQKWALQALEATPAVTDIDHQTFAKVQELNGALKELLALRHIIFPPVEGESDEERGERVKQISGWVILARNGNPNGLLGMNWFVKAGA